MPTIREGFGNETAANRAFLRRAVGGDVNHPTTSARSLVVEHRKKPCPRRVAHALRDMTAAEAVHIQVLTEDQAKFLD